MRRMPHVSKTTVCAMGIQAGPAKIIPRERAVAPRFRDIYHGNEIVDSLSDGRRGSTDEASDSVLIQGTKKYGRSDLAKGASLAKILSTPMCLIGDVFALVYRAAPGYEAHLSPHGTLALSGDAGDYWLNTAIINDGPGAEASLRHATVTLRERSLPGWFMHDERLTTRLAPIAREAGLDDGGTAPFMVYRPAPHQSLSPVSGDLAVSSVRNASDLRDANRVTAAAFGSPQDAIDRVWGPALLEMPGLELFLGRRDGEAISVVMTVRHGAVVGIWTMGTVPERQRSGAGRQLLATVLQLHTQHNVVAFYLVAFEAGRRLYEQIGFHPEAEIQIWITPGASAH
jgi:GNAT superfamily N-acetyltransferase